MLIICFFGVYYSALGRFTAGIKYPPKVSEFVWKRDMKVDGLFISLDVARQKSIL